MKYGDKPLRPEELQHMANKPYWHVGLRKHSVPPHWVILDPLIARNPEDYEYGKSWLAYTYQPIDFSEWEPCCKMCKAKCTDCEHFTDKVKGKAEFCKSCKDGSNFKSPYNSFCPHCGRPLTDRARKMLESRLTK